MATLDDLGNPLRVRDNGGDLGNLAVGIPNGWNGAATINDPNGTILGYGTPTRGSEGDTFENPIYKQVTNPEYMGDWNNFIRPDYKDPNITPFQVWGDWLKQTGTSPETIDRNYGRDPQINQTMEAFWNWGNQQFKDAGVDKSVTGWESPYALSNPWSKKESAFQSAMPFLSAMTLFAMPFGFSPTSLLSKATGMESGIGNLFGNALSGADKFMTDLLGTGGSQLTNAGSSLFEAGSNLGSNVLNSAGGDLTGGGSTMTDVTDLGWDNYNNGWDGDLGNNFNGGTGNVDSWNSLNGNEAGSDWSRGVETAQNPGLNTGGGSGFNNFLKSLGVTPGQLGGAAFNALQQLWLGNKQKDIANQAADRGNPLTQPGRSPFYQQELLRLLTQQGSQDFLKTDPTAIALTDLFQNKIMPTAFSKSGNMANVWDTKGSQLSTSLSELYNQKIQHLITAAGLNQGPGYSGSLYGQYADKGATTQSTALNPFGSNVFGNIINKVTNSVWDSIFGG